jgi:uncharacterized protein (DUF4213/DUF364 family)
VAALTDRVLPAVLSALDSRGGLAGVRLDRVTVGAAVVLVELVVDAGGDETRLAGLAHNPAGVGRPPPADDLEAILAPISRAADEPGGEIADGAFERAPAVASVNALSSPYIEWQRGDPMALLAPSVENVVTVGLFRPAFRKFADVEVRVIEREPANSIQAPEGVSVRQFDPTETETAMRDAEVVFVTGSALVYGGLEAYLRAAPTSATVVVVGATASALPEPLFARGADIVAGAVIVDLDRTRRAVEAGACGTDLHDRGVRKGYVAAEPSENVRLS